ncbi:hypothetical protein D9M70_449540 [compost metagenome]
MNHGVKVMTSVYKRDMGNGVVIYADDYVKTGRWVFDCKYGRLVSREPLPVPFAELERVEKFEIGNVYLQDVDEQPAREALNAIMGVHGWYRKLRYRFSGLDDYSELSMHVFDLIATHEERKWALNVWKFTQGNMSDFTVIIEPYFPETYLDHARALQAAAGSCPSPQ